jgi:hypothetical protein
MRWDGMDPIDHLKTTPSLLAVVCSLQKMSFATLKMLSIYGEPNYYYIPVDKPDEIEALNDDIERMKRSPRMATKCFELDDTNLLTEEQVDAIIEANKNRMSTTNRMSSKHEKIVDPLEYTRKREKIIEKEITREFAVDFAENTTPFFCEFGAPKPTRYVRLIRDKQPRVIYLQLNGNEDDLEKVGEMYSSHEYKARIDLKTIFDSEDIGDDDYSLVTNGWLTFGKSWLDYVDQQGLYSVWWFLCIYGPSLTYYV